MFFGLTSDQLKDHGGTQNLRRNRFIQKQNIVVLVHRKITIVILPGGISVNFWYK